MNKSLTFLALMLLAGSVEAATYTVSCRSYSGPGYVTATCTDNTASRRPFPRLSKPVTISFAERIANQEKLAAVKAEDVCEGDYTKKKKDFQACQRKLASIINRGPF